MVLIFIFASWSLIATIITTVLKIKQQLPSKRQDSYIYLFYICSPLFLGLIISQIDHKLFDDVVSETVETASIKKQHSYAATVQQLQDSLEVDYFDHDKHIAYIQKHFDDFHEIAKKGEMFLLEPHAGLRNFYYYKSLSEEEKYRITSLWALGITDYYDGMPDSCIIKLKPYLALPYAKLYTALSFEMKNKKDSANFYYLAEYKSTGKIPDSLVHLLITRVIKHPEPFELLKEVVYTSSLTDRIPNYLQKRVYYLSSDWSNYILILLKEFFKEIFSWEFLVASLVSFMWLYYLFQLDIFDREKIFYPAVTILMAMITTEVVPVFYDFYRYTLHWELNGNALDDLIFSVVAIGFTEEIAKILPLFILLNFTKAIDESYDYLFYASVSALTFAWLENSGYFIHYGGPTIVARTLTTTVAHIFFSSTIAYGMIYAKRFYKNKYLYTFLFFLLACLAHGLYDWLLFFKWSIVFNIGLFGAMMIWFIYLNNALNISSRFNVFMKVNVKRIELAFILMLSTILICQYLLDKLVNKDTETINKIWISVFYCIFFNLFYVSRIGKMDLVEGYWRPISIRDNNIPVGRRDVRSPFDLRVMFVNFFLVNAIQPKNYFGLKVILYYNGKVGNNAFPKEFFIEGVVADRCLVRREVAYNKYEIDPNYFWIHLDEYIKIGTNYITNAMLVKQTDYFEDLASGIAVDLALFRFHAPNGIVPKEFAEDDLYFLGYCLCSMRVEGQESSPKIMG